MVREFAASEVRSHFLSGPQTLSRRVLRQGRCDNSTQRQFEDPAL